MTQDHEGEGGRFDPARVIDITEAERGAVIAWLQRRAAMCRDAERWYRPFRRIYLRRLGAALKSSAVLIKECVHLAPTMEQETAILSRVRLAQAISTGTAKTAQPVEGEACQRGDGTSCAQPSSASDPTP